MLSKVLYLAAGLVAISLCLTAMMLWVYLQVPHLDDFYNLVYSGDRLNKPESTAVFLFSFPVLCSAGSVILISSLMLRTRRQISTSEGPLAFFVVVWIVFAAVTMMRFSAVTAFYNL